MFESFDGSLNLRIPGRFGSRKGSNQDQDPNKVELTLQMVLVEGLLVQSTAALFPK